MRPAFPASDYYGPSAPFRRHQPTAGLPTTGGRHRDGSHVHHASIDAIDAQLFPCSIATSTPQTFLAASPPTALRRLRSPRPRPRTAYAALRPTSTRFEPASLSRAFSHWFTLVTPSVSLSERWTVRWSRSPRRLRGCSHPHPRFRDQAAPSFRPAAATARRRSPFISIRLVAPRGAQCGADAHGDDLQFAGIQTPRTYGRTRARLSAPDCTPSKQRRNFLRPPNPSHSDRRSHLRLPPEPPNRRRPRPASGPTCALGSDRTRRADAPTRRLRAWR